jgi:hypothetical protein
LEDLPKNIDANVYISLPDGTSVDILYIVHQEPDDILILGFDEKGHEMITSLPYRTINLSIVSSPLKAGSERIEVRLQLEDGKTELTGSRSIKMTSTTFCTEDEEEIYSFASPFGGRHDQPYL